MKAKKLSELSYEEREQYAELLHTWLKKYTDKVITRVLPKAEEIYNDPAAMMLLQQLHERETKENSKGISDMSFYLMKLAEGSFEESTLHNNVLEHSGSYRDVLYDLYIAD